MFCGNCGAKKDENAAFCSNCGVSQDEVKVAEVTNAPAAVVQASGYQNLLAANGLAQNVKHFDALFTQIAVSQDGYIAVYYPYEKEIPDTRIARANYLASHPERQERLELFHVSQINSFDIEYYGEETTHVSGGAGGAIVGGLLDGTLGSIIGSSLTSGTVTSDTQIDGVSLILNTKDFNNPRVEILLYKKWGLRGHNLCTPFALRKHIVYGNWKGSMDKEGKRLLKEVYGCKDGTLVYHYKPNIVQIEALHTILTQMFAAQQQNEVAASSAPQLSSADELAKYKSLLDSGVITQDEFDAKKKQLLGL